MVSETQNSEGIGTTSKTHTSPNTSDAKKHTNKYENQKPSSSYLSYQNTTDSTACLITPSNIHISHMCVYNFTPDLRDESPSFSPHSKVPSKYQSPAASSGPICRICHEGDGKEDLVSPCRCAGTVGLVHKSCMERWLSTRIGVNDKCEICSYKFSTIRSPKSILEMELDNLSMDSDRYMVIFDVDRNRNLNQHFLNFPLKDESVQLCKDWIKSDDKSGFERRGLMGDVTCFFLLTPVALVSSFLCVEGTKKQVLLGNSTEAGCLVGLATFLITLYFIWNAFTLRYHLRKYLKWRETNYNVKLVRLQRVSTRSEESHGVQLNSQVSGNNPLSQIVISIPESPEMRVPTNISVNV